MKHIAVSSHHLPYYRMAGYVVTIIMHAVNVSVMLYRFRGDVFQDPNIQTFYFFTDKFITCWTFTSQFIHAVLGLTCEILTLLDEGQEKYPLLGLLKNVKKALFAGIVVPLTLMVSTVFWPLFLYDRELVLPTFTTKIVNGISNHIMHSAIVPATFWEIAFGPRELPRTHSINLFCTASFTGSYLFVVFKTYYTLGLFPYPIMKMLYGSVYFVLLLVTVISIIPLHYCGQWTINKMFWRLIKIETREDAVKKEL